MASEADKFWAIYGPQPTLEREAYQRILDGAKPVDPIDHPPHYEDSEIECIDAIQAAFPADAVSWFARIAAFQYIWRAHRKGGVDDLRKAIWYLRLAAGDDPREKSQVPPSQTEE